MWKPAASHSGAQAPIPVAPLSTQLPTNVPRQAAKHGPSVWAPISHDGELDVLSGSWLQLVLTLALGAI